MNLARTAILTVLATTLTAGQPAFRSWPVSQAPEDLRPAISSADVAIVAMQGEVLRELTNAIARERTESGVAFCHIDVSGTIQTLGRNGAAAGRTSDRLRNPENAPRAWAAPFVAAHAGQRARDVEGYAVDLGDKVGVLRPIVEQPMCAGCHGTADRLSPGVRLLLKRRYPSDTATGFRDGEIRGWFWVEMPKRTAARIR
jgi:uncharacterized protein DUF3365